MTGLRRNTWPAKSTVAVAATTATEPRNGASASVTEAFASTFGCAQSKVPEAAWEKLRVDILDGDAAAVISHNTL